jgi:hypothetical protein
MEPSVAVIHASNRCDPVPFIAPFSSLGIRRDRRAGRQKARMINRVASDGTVLARSRGDEFCLIDRSEKKSIVCERRIHREALNIFLAIAG